MTYGVAAYLSWGLFPLYFPLLAPASALEILAHRIVWSLLFVGILLRVRRSLRGPLLASGAGTGKRRTLGFLTAAAVLIAINWFTYVWAVTHEAVVETSLGYFIGPLVSMLLGVVILREQLNGWQRLAVGIAALAVVVLTVSYGRLPWVALTLAGSFGLYGFCKKKAAAGAAESLAVETAVLAPFALGCLVFLQMTGELAFGHTGWVKALLLASAGVFTAIPLMLFAAAATRIPLVLIGVLQYIAPSLQFLFGVLLLGEPMPPIRLVGFVIVWVALAVFTWGALSARRPPGGPLEQQPLGEGSR